MLKDTKKSWPHGPTQNYAKVEDKYKGLVHATKLHK